MIAFWKTQFSNVINLHYYYYYYLFIVLKKFFYFLYVKILLSGDDRKMFGNNESPVTLKHREWRKQQGTWTTLFTSRSLYAANFITPVSVHSLTVSYLSVLVTLHPHYILSESCEETLVAPGSDQPLLYYVQVAAMPSTNYFFIVLNSNSFRFLPSWNS